MANYTTLSLDSIKLLCGLIRDLASVSDGILDTAICTDKTFSSYYIDLLLKQLKADSEAYTDEVASALTKLTAEVVTVEPTLDNTTNKINTILLYSPDGNDVYDQYLRLETQLISLGSTQISMADYIKTSEADNKYSTKTELKAVTDKIGTTTLTTTAQTLTGSIEEVKTSVPTDDDIKLLADGQIDSKKQILGFNDLKGITADSTLDDVVKAVPNGKIAILQSANFTNYLGLPHQMYTITINSLGYNRNQIIATAKYSDNPSISFIGGCDNSSGTDIYDQWIKMPTTNDITTTISSASTDTQIPSAKAVNDLLQTEGSGNLTIPLNEDLNNLTYNRTRVWMNTQTVEIATFTNMPSGKYTECAVIFIPYGNATTDYGEQIFVGNNNRIFIRNKVVSTTWTAWRRVCSTKVADTSGTVTLPDGVTGTISYKVINGICYVSIQGLADGLTGVQASTFTGLPKADMYINIGIENLGNRVGSIYSDDGAIFYIHKTVTTSGYGSFSYPVAES